MSWRTAAVLSVLMATTALAGAQAQSKEVGVLAAVNRDMTGERPAEAPRQVFLQDKLVTNERIESSPDGGGQVLFLDQTSLTITKNSEIILDKYVYDPDTDSGELGVSVLKGAMRMVGGRITKKKPALIRTPSATIGIRGGIGNVTVRPDGSTIYMHVAGVASTIEGADNEVLTITREGGVAVVQDSGQVEYVGVADPETVNAIFNPKATGEGDGQSSDDEGGSSSGGSDEQKRQEQTAAAEAGADQVSQENSGDGDTTKEAPVSTEGERQQRDDDEPEIALEDDSEEEQSENAAEEIAQGIDEDIDQLFFNGTYSPTIVGGAAAGIAPNLTFQMIYSINAAEGLVIVELPEDALDSGAGSSETIEGDAIFSDSFIVGGTDIQALTAANEPTTLLGGNANGVLLSISPDITVSGDVGIDYTNSSLVNADSLSAQIDDVAGEALDDINGATTSDIVDGLRSVINDQ